MRFLLLLTIILITSCENNKETVANRQQSIKKDMEEVKAFYYKKMDSLESVKQADTNSARSPEIAQEISATDSKRVSELLKLQKEFDSLEVELKKH